MLLLILLCACVIAPSRGSVSCVGDDGEDTAWFTLFKEPNSTYYAYGNFAGIVKKGEHDLNSLKNPLAATLGPLYAGEIGVNYLMYNDQAPDGRKSDNRGHTKGVLMWDDTALVWLIHSVPGFPPLQASRYSYPDSGRVYGQTALCLTMVTNDFFNKAVNQLYFTWPFIYEYNVATIYRISSPTLDLLLKGKHRVAEPYVSTTALRTRSAEFISYAKTGAWGRDIYKELVAPGMATNFVANTWLSGPGALPSNCTGLYSVWNAADIQILDTTWKTSKDHSKWATSYAHTTDEKKFVVCIGGVNRMAKQMQRGGGTFCVRNELLWRTLNKNLWYYLCVKDGQLQASTTMVKQ